MTDRLGLGLAWLLGLLFCAIAVAIVVFLAVQGIRYLSPNLIWTNPQVGFTQGETGGFLDPLIGTILVAGIAIAIAGPVGVGVAVWLSEYGRPTGLARVVESTVEMLAGAPSVVLALFGILLFEAPALGFLSETNDGVVFGKSFFAAGAMLSLVALPMVVSTVREGLQAIPNHVREASYAVGKTKIATIRRVLLPAARPSVITGNMLGIGHVIGDTAIIVLLLGDTQTLQGVGHIPLLGTLRGTGEHADQLHLRQRADRRSQPAEQGLRGRVLAPADRAGAERRSSTSSVAGPGSCDGAEKAAAGAAPVARRPGHATASKPGVADRERQRPWAGGAVRLGPSCSAVGGRDASIGCRWRSCRSRTAPSSRSSRCRCRSAKGRCSP